MEIIYKIKDFAEPGDQDLYKGIQEFNKRDYKSALKLFKKSSSYDNEYAIVFLAIFYLKGYGLEKSEPLKALTELKKAASKWNTLVAQYILGTVYLHGYEGVDRDFESALDWLKLAGLNGWSSAFSHIVNFHISGEYTAPHLGKAMPFLEYLADMEPVLKKSDDILYLFGTEDFQLDLSKIDKSLSKNLKFLTSQYLVAPFMAHACEESDLINGEPEKQEEKKEVLFWKSMISNSDNLVCDSQFSLGIVYLSGKDHIAADYNKALDWFKKAANNGSKESYKLIGSLYEKGIGAEVDYKEALKCYMKAKELGDFLVFYDIARVYFHGLGVPIDYKISLEYIEAFNQYAASGHSFLFMGNIHFSGGFGVSQDYKKALDNYTKAVDKGNGEAASKVGIMYLLGRGVRKSEDKAYEWFLKGDALDCAESQIWLGCMHHDGYKGRIDFCKALEFYSKSAKGGNELAICRMAELQMIISMSAISISQNSLKEAIADKKRQRTRKR